MEVAGLVLGIISTIDVCIHRGDDLVQMCRAFKHADVEIDQRVAIIESSVYRTNEQLKVIRRMDKELDDSFKMMQKRLIDIFIAKLQDVVARLERIAKARIDENGQRQYTIKKSKYSMVKKHLDSAISEMESWQQRFDPAWKLALLQSGGSSVDVLLTEHNEAQKGSQSAPAWKDIGALRKMVKNGQSSGVSLFLPAGQLAEMHAHRIPFSSLMLYRQSNPRRQYIVDTVDTGSGYLNKAGENALMAGVRDLAEKLSFVEPVESSRVGLLQCRGFINPGAGDFRFVFRQPQQAEMSSPPRSLRGMLVGATQHSLTERINLAKQLSRAVSYIHSLGFVHKNIRPETIAGFKIGGSPALESVFLTGFGRVRAAGGPTSLLGDAELEKNLYQHPDRQGIHPEEAYVMQHDIYSLGVCLLEVGLWKSFVAYNGHDEGSGVGVIRSLASCPSSFALKASLVQMAISELPSKLGNKFCAIVVNCLTCLDEDNLDFGDSSDVENENGIQIGVRYMEKIMLALEDIEI